MSRMKFKAVGTLSLLAVLGGAALGVSPADAATTVPAAAITNDPNASNGSLTFFNSTGGVITSGTNLSRLFDFARASTPASRAASNKATVYFAFPDHTQADSNNWFSNQATTPAAYPNAANPAPLNTGSQPVAKAGAGDANLASLLPTTTQDTTSGYNGILQVRLYDTGPGASQQSVFWATDIYYDQAANTWSQVYPAVPATSLSAITATPVSPAPAGTTSVALSSTLTAADGSHPTGSVELFNGSTDLGAATFNATTGAVSKTAAVADNGSYSYTFVYSPSAAVQGSTSPVLAYSVNGPAQATTTVLSGPTSTTVGTAVTIHANVNTAAGTAVPAGAGTVQFKVDGVNAGNPVTLTASGADFTFNPSAAGSNTITGSFAPADPSKYVASSDTTGVTVVTTAPAYAPDAQTFTTTVPAGTLVISTPYTVQNPFNLGTMQLNAAGTSFVASASFGDPAAPATTDPGTLGSTALTAYPAGKTSNGVTITDTRAASTGWTASAQTTDFTNPGLSTVINGDNLAFTGVAPKYLAGNALQAGSVVTNDITAFKSAKKSFATTAAGPGTVNITGVMGLTAPTSTKPGAYTATVTFTIV